MLYSLFLRGQALLELSFLYFVHATLTSTRLAKRKTFVDLEIFAKFYYRVISRESLNGLLQDHRVGNFLKTRKRNSFNLQLD